MAQCTKAGGEIIKLTARVDLFTLTETSTMECGKTTKLMGPASTVILMVQSMKEIG